VQISWLSLKTKAYEFPGLCLKIGSSGLVIWSSKSPRQVFGLGLKTKRSSVCLLHHKTDRESSVWDTCQDLIACFTWKQVGLKFSSLASWWRRDYEWCTWYYHGDRVELKLKTDGSMRWAVSDPSTLGSLFSLY
jgi:hypothetical protein